MILVPPGPTWVITPFPCWTTKISGKENPQISSHTKSATIKIGYLNLPRCKEDVCLKQMFEMHYMLRYVYWSKGGGYNI